MCLRLIIVEYNVDRENYWVPHPISYPKLKKLVEESGFGETRLLATRSSSFLKEFYSALSFKEELPQSPAQKEFGVTKSMVEHN